MRIQIVKQSRAKLLKSLHDLYGFLRVQPSVSLFSRITRNFFVPFAEFQVKADVELVRVFGRLETG